MFKKFLLTALFLASLAPNIFAAGIDAFVVYGSHFDGADAATTATDFSTAQAAKTITFSGNAQLDTADFKFSTAALLLDGSGDWVAAASSSDFIFGTGDFTVDFWMKLASGASSDNTMLTSGGSAGTGIFLEWSSATGNKIAARINTVDELVGTSSVSTNAWHHIEFSRNGSTLYLFVDGVEQGAGQTSSADVSSNTYGFDIGREDANRWYFNGWIDEFRVSKGITRHTSNFTPGTTPYSSGGGATGRALAALGVG